MQSDGRFSIAFPKRWWYPACASSALGRKPIPITLMETPVVVFRDGSGNPRALLDRCPHRNLALSCGRVTGGDLECGYHGWRFSGDGTCTAIPGLVALRPPESPTRNVNAYATTEADGFVWVWGEPGEQPSEQPFALPPLSGRGAGEVVFTYDLECTLHAALENHLDVPHTAFLHRGIFRGGDRREIEVIRREVENGVEVEYVGEPVGLGPVRGKQGSELTFDHWDRFFMPGVAQIEYRVGTWLRIVNTILHLPLAPHRTRAWFVVRFWTPAPAAAIRPIVLARGRKILKQDADVLALQTENIQRFGGERYASTDLDVMGNAIWRLLRRAERTESSDELSGIDDDAEDAEPAERRVTFRI